MIIIPFHYVCLVEAGQYSCFFVYLRLVSFRQLTAAIRRVFLCVFSRLDARLFGRWSGVFHRIHWNSFLYCSSNSRSRSRLWFGSVFRWCLDSSTPMSSTILWCQRNHHGGIILSNRSISVVRHRHIELVGSVVFFRTIDRANGWFRVMWFTGGLAALSSITYPSISAFVSVYAKENQQGEAKMKKSRKIYCGRVLGLVQGMVNGVRGLCNGLGPAVFGFIFFLFNVDLNHTSVPSTSLTKIEANQTRININQNRFASSMLSRDIPGPPFLFGAFLAAIALMFSLLLPNSKFEMHSSSHDTRTIEQEARLLELNDDDDGESKHRQVDWVDGEHQLLSFIFCYAESLRNDQINEFLGKSFFQLRLPICSFGYSFLFKKEPKSKKETTD